MGEGRLKYFSLIEKSQIWWQVGGDFPFLHIYVSSECYINYTLKVFFTQQISTVGEVIYQSQKSKATSVLWAWKLIYIATSWIYTSSFFLYTKLRLTMDFKAGLVSCGSSCGGEKGLHILQFHSSTGWRAMKDYSG